MTTASDLLKRIKDEDIKYVDLRFTDMRGKLQHVTFDQTIVDEDLFEEGTMFDGSSIAGWKAINDCDMVLMPDPGLGLHGPVLLAVDDGHQLRHSRSADLPALQPRPAHHGQEGRGLREVDRHRRQRLFRPGARVLPVRRRALLEHHVQGRLRGRLERVPVEQRHRVRSRQQRPPHRPQEGLLPGPAARQRAGHPRRDARGDGRDGRADRKAPPRSGVGPARARHQVLPDHQGRRLASRSTST